MTTAWPTAGAQRARVPTIVAAVDSLARSAVADGLTPALGVAIVMDGAVVYREAFGYADVTAGIRADRRTLWYVASTSKMFTGVAVALLASRGAVQPTAPIAALLPDVVWHPSVNARALTLADFLAHTHGLADTALVMSAAYTGAVPERRWPALLGLAPASGARDLVYGNLGYNVAAMVIDRLRPEGWKQFVHDALFGPIGMQHTYARVSGLPPARIARPHRLLGDGRYRTEPFAKVDATMNAAGGHLATLDDLARWTIVQMDSGRLEGRTVVAPEAVALAQQSLAAHTRDAARRFAFFDRDGWGMGWDLGRYEGDRMIGRFGAYHSFRSHVSFLPDRRVGVIAMSTGGAGTALTDIIAALVYDLAAGRADALPRATARVQELHVRMRSARTAAMARDSAERARGLTPRRVPTERHVGHYGREGYGVLTIVERRGRLAYRWGALQGTLLPVDTSGARFETLRAGGRVMVEFSRSPGGTSAHLVFDDMLLPRVPSTRDGRPPVQSR
jgi:CubicO group peptidase (beta-lactamase class C family)